MNEDTLCAEPPAASDADAGPSSPVSVGTASGGTGNQAGSESQMRPQSVSVWVAGDAAPGVAAVEPPGTGVRSGDAEADGGGDEATLLGLAPGVDVLGVAGDGPAALHALSSTATRTAVDAAAVRRGVTASS